MNMNSSSKKSDAKFAAVAVMFVSLLLIGCGRVYKTPLDTSENISTSSTIEIDGRRVEGATVRKITSDANGQRIAEFTTGKETIRRGTVRVPSDNTIDLRTDQSSAEILPFGATIPVQSKLAFIANKWSGKTLVLIGIAAVIAAVALQRFLAFRALLPVVPILAATGLAALTAYAGHQFVVPVIQDFQSKIHSAKSPEVSESIATATTSGTWADKIRGTEKEVTNFLRTPTDSARLLAFLSVFIVALPIFACLISWLFRKLAPSPVLCSLLLLAAPIAANAAPGRVYYELAGLKEEQRVIQETIAEAQRNLDTASGLFDAHLSGASEHLVLTFFQSDLAAIRIEGQTDRIAQLKSSFGRIKSDDQKKLTTVYASLRQQIQSVQLDAAKLSQRVNAATNATTALKIFQSRQTDFRNQIRGGFSDPKIVLEECNRHLAAAPAANVEVKPRENGKSATEFAKLQRDQLQLQAQVAELRRATNSPPKTIIVTNERVVEKLVPAPVPPPEIRYITNTLPGTEPTNSPSFKTENDPESSTNQSDSVAATSDGNGNGTTPPASASKPRPNVALIAAIIGGAAVLCALGWFAYLASLRGRPFVLSLAGISGKTEEIELAAMDDALCLQTPPICESVNNVNGAPHITITWRGPVLRPGTHSAARINDVPVSGQQKLFPGDCILIEGEKPQQFNFLGCDPVCAGVTAEAQS
jgi:hypothetical protein